MIIAPTRPLRLLKRLLLPLAALLVHGAAAAQAPEFDIAGFATLGAVTTDRSDMWFTRYGVNYPSGSDPDFSPDSLLGLQASMRLSPDNDITLQAVTSEDSTNSYAPRITLAFFRQTLAPGLSVRAGRVRVPFFMLSDSLLVNYANLWVRPPVEVYGLNPFNDLDGVDFIYHFRAGELDVELHPYFGSGGIPIPEGKTRLERARGLNVVLTRGDFSLHLGHGEGRFSLRRADENFQALTAGLSALGLSDVVTDLSGRDGRTSFDSVGMQWDDGDWQVIGEYARRRTDRYVTSSSAWYLSVGRRFGTRFGTVTPYLSLARQVLDEPIATAAIPPAFPALEAAWKAFLTSRNNAQRSITLGARWDIAPPAALKIEFMHTRLDHDAWGSYFPRGNLATTRIEGKSANTLSLSIDLTF